MCESPATATARLPRPNKAKRLPVRAPRILVFLIWISFMGLLTGPPLAAQAVVESVSPANSSIRILRLGQSAEEPAQAGAELFPGDLLLGTGGQVGVQCPVEDGPVFVFSDGFRLMIDVPNDSGCTVDLLAGTVDVITDEPTEVHAGGVTMGSEGTAYSTTVRPDRQVHVSVFEGTVLARSDRLAPTSTEAGHTLVWDPREVTANINRNSMATVRRASRTLGAYDAARAAQTADTTPNVRALTREFQNLYVRVLSNAQDTTSRIDLARTQATYSLNERAFYHLKQAAVTDTATMRQYNIDPVLLRRGLPTKYEAYYEANVTTEYMRRGVVMRRADMVQLQPDLTVEATGPATARAGQDIGSLLSITASNRGGRTAPGTASSDTRGYMIDLVLSPDSQLSAGFSVYAPEYRDNVLLRGGRYSNTNDIPAGGSWSPGRSSAIIPADTPPGRYCLGVVVDPGRAVSEANEDNNTYCVWIRVTR